MKRQQLIQELEALGKEIFSMKDLRKLFPQESNLKMSVKRMLDAGVLMQVTRSIYTLKGEPLDIEKVATQLYYPSYISFESALSKYGIINQGLYGLTLATSRHSKKFTLAGVDCEYSQLKPTLFFGFDLVSGTYLAQPEKAFLDQLYLMILGKRTGNTLEWDLDPLDDKRLKAYLKFYNRHVQEKASQMGL
jgi:predicted transcriptional regulator of viral defense system